MRTLSSRRRVLLSVSLAGLVPRIALAQDQQVLAARAFERNIVAVTQGATLRNERVRLDIAPLIDNGNTIPIEITVDSPMTPADFVRRIVVINERNPLPEVANFNFTAASGKAQVATRIRLATSQQLIAIAQMSNGTFWAARADVIVTLAACIED